MLVLSRRPGEAVCVTAMEAIPAGATIKVKVSSVKGKLVRVALDAPPEFKILREELASQTAVGS